MNQDGPHCLLTPFFLITYLNYIVSLTYMICDTIIEIYSEVWLWHHPQKQYGKFFILWFVISPLQKTDLLCRPFTYSVINLRFRLRKGWYRYGTTKNILKINDVKLKDYESPYYKSWWTITKIIEETDLLLKNIKYLMWTNQCKHGYGLF